ncbi:ABC transporter permease [Natronococcus sp. A-GB7]|uniref:ABC transporter permease n=1 Tax=Natronococcus sp. A-GB7 TaxID=3037649 RepID=UPI0024204BBB|nr:ABC transporter permease [Natronococcus sp. A-GB7]MDG5821397.1 ABC transporter permease [Natronococcus sp. A-GB7]
MLDDRTTSFYFAILLVIVVMGLFGPMLAPHDVNATHYDDNGDILRAEAPSVDHPLGTTHAGYDVFSRILVGARPTVLTGLIGGGMILSIGTAVGVTAGYVGGKTETVLMRFTDFVYGVPLIPFAIVLITFMGVGFLSSALVIGLILWRGAARVIRAQTMQVKQYPFVKVAKASGASTPRIIFKHILPNVAPMAIFFLAMGVGYAIILQAGLTFLGVADPFVPSWGVMIRNAFDSGYMATAPWWSLTPGLLIGITVLSTFMFGRGYEDLIDEDAESVDAEAVSA